MKTLPELLDELSKQGLLFKYTQKVKPEIKSKDAKDSRKKGYGLAKKKIDDSKYTGKNSARVPGTDNSMAEEALDEVQGGGINVQYSSDSKLVPDDKGGYRKVRARRIKVGDKAPDPSQIDAPDVEDNGYKNRDRAIDLYTKYYKKYMKGLKHNMGEQKEHQEDPPFVLVLKRQTIRQFPNNVKVALYLCDKLNKYFSVAYGPDGVSTFQAEEYESDEQELVSNILNTFCNLSEDNQKIMLEMINGDSETFNKIKEFSLNESNTTDI